jgi:large subunit ribosomal protein L23
MAVPVPPPPKLNPRLGPHQVIVRPLVTEKGMHRANRHGAYSFEVVTEATKTDIRRAVEEMFNVKVEKVAVQNRIGKARRSRTRTTSTKAWKKAVVTLKPDFKIDLF